MISASKFVGKKIFFENLQVPLNEKIQSKRKL